MTVPTDQRRHKIVMAIDDQPDMLMLIQSFVETAGYSFVGAMRGRDAAIIAERMTLRLILIDVDMPELNGFETCRLLRANPKLRAVPIAFLTARKTSEDVTNGLAAGGNDFILKPFAPDKLVERLEYWVGRRV